MKTNKKERRSLAQLIRDMAGAGGDSKRTSSKLTTRGGIRDGRADQVGKVEEDISSLSLYQFYLCHR